MLHYFKFVENPLWKTLADHLLKRASVRKQRAKLGCEQIQLSGKVFA
jgi:hypothetical protein